MNSPFPITLKTTISTPELRTPKEKGSEPMVGRGTQRHLIRPQSEGEVGAVAEERPGVTLISCSWSV